MCLNGVMTVMVPIVVIHKKILKVLHLHPDEYTVAVVGAVMPEAAVFHPVTGLSPIIDIDILVSVLHGILRY